jgi:hypothetical protein
MRASLAGASSRNKATDYVKETLSLMPWAETHGGVHLCSEHRTEGGPNVLAAVIAEIRLLTTEFEVALAQEVELEHALDDQRSRLRQCDRNGGHSGPCKSGLH